jgi:D-amino-acid dehydrogenase
MNPEATKLVREMAVESLAILEEIVKSGLIEPEFTKKGTLFVYASQEKLQRHIRDLKEKLGHLSIPYKVLGASECREHEPLLSDRVAGGILFKEDAWVNPSRLLLQMRELLARLGVKIITREATRLEVSSGRVIGVRVDGEYLKAANYVLSIGSHTKQLLSKVGLIIPVAPAWGYTVVLEAASHRIRRPIIIGEKRLAVSQTLDGNIRLSGFFELSPLDYSPPRSRYLWLRENASDLLPIAKDLRTVDEWAGARPCTPDGLPIIGRISTLKNALLAVGHCREGLTLAPATGKMVSEIIRFDAKPDRLLSPDRFGL